MSRSLRSDSFVFARPPVRDTGGSLGWAGILGIFVFGVTVGALFGRAIWLGAPPAASVAWTRPAAPASAAMARNVPPPGRYAADVLRVIDGDTFEARVHVWLGQDIVTRIRLRGIDAPERKARCAAEHEQAAVATDALRRMLADDAVTVWNVGPDRYFGRVVAQAGTSATPDISAALLARGLVRPYAGGHRSGWC
jgi:endonuclease YncB( thermonuclease family)